MIWEAKLVLIELMNDGWNNDLIVPLKCPLASRVNCLFAVNLYIY